jgi:diguanylate cyclase (GGDEF)-like protein
VQEASEKLSVVNQALEGEVRERHLLEHQLATVIEQEEAARHAAFHDPLTGLPNRVLFNDRLEHGLARARRHGWTLAVMFVDLDDFKNINDSYGHDVGDGVLQTIAGRLKENTRGDDTVSRHGGDEFLYLLMEVRDEQDIKLIAEKIIKSIKAPCEISVGDLTVTPSINASIGISIFPADGSSADALVKSADKTMYQAKRDKSGYSFARVQ